MNVPTYMVTSATMGSGSYPWEKKDDVGGLSWDRKQGDVSVQWVKHFTHKQDNLRRPRTHIKSPTATACICNPSTSTARWRSWSRESPRSSRVNQCGAQSLATEMTKDPMPNKVEGENWLAKVVLHSDLHMHTKAHAYQHAHTGTVHAHTRVLECTHKHTSVCGPPADAHWILLSMRNVQSLLWNGSPWGHPFRASAVT